MRLIKYFFFLSLLFSTFAFTQNGGGNHTSWSAVAYYHFSHIRDTNRAARTWEEDFVLVFDSRKSVYASITRLAQDSANMAKAEAAMAAGSDVVNMGVMYPTTQENILLQDDAVYIHRNLIGNNILIREPLDKINWQIESETRQILGYTCQKASGVCKGRAYTAWFTTDIPVATGPWKLNGLPGLILEAADAHGRIRFACTRVAVGGIIPHKLSMELPANATFSTHTEFARMQKAQMEGFAVSGGGSGDIAVERTTVNGAEVSAPARKPVMNYPLELIR